MEKVDKEENNSPSHPQCQFFVVRKKRLCHMTVKQGRNYCGEHEPQPGTGESKDDTRIPCPYDPKHTCYSSKLEKHMAICNARQREVPDYISYNINGPSDEDDAPRLLLSQVPQHKIQALIDKVNILYDKYVKDNISILEELPIHVAIQEDFREEGRTESSLRHLRQASSLLHLAETEGLVQDGTCYVELGAGKGRLAYYAHRAWCGGPGGGRVLAVERAAPRHKRDNRAGGGCERVRADLAHLTLRRLPAAAPPRALVGLAKHLCGVATDYALRCLVAADAEGALLATCCHHRCRCAALVAVPHLQELGVDAEELDALLGLVSWATCGWARGATDGREAARRREAGARAKALLDEGRARFLRAHGYCARLCRFVPPHVSPENLCIVAVRARAPLADQPPRAAPYTQT